MNCKNLLSLLSRIFLISACIALITGYPQWAGWMGLAAMAASLISSRCR